VKVPPHIPVTVVAKACGYPVEQTRRRLRAMGLLKVFGTRDHAVGWIQLQERDPDMALAVHSLYADQKKSG